VGRGEGTSATQIWPFAGVLSSGKNSQAAGEPVQSIEIRFGASKPPTHKFISVRSAARIIFHFCLGCNLFFLQGAGSEREKN
jgi:hypothetical protein